MTERETKGHGYRVTRVRGQDRGLLSLAVIIHHAVLRPFDVIKLTGLDRPEEDEPAGKADKEHENDERDDRPKH